jgi:hypothetical protein
MSPFVRRGVKSVMAFFPLHIWKSPLNKWTLDTIDFCILFKWTNYIHKLIGNIYVSPSNEGRHIVLVWFFLLPLPLLHLLLLLLLSEACERNNYLTLRSKVKVQRRSLRYATYRLMIMYPHTKCHWPISKNKNVIRRCVAYRNDLRWTWTFDLKVK